MAMSARKARAKELQVGDIYQMYGKKRLGTRRQVLKKSRRGRKVYISYAYEVTDEDHVSFRREPILPVHVLNITAMVWLHQ